MRIVWFILGGFAVGALAVLFIINPALLNPENLITAITDFFATIQTHSPDYYIKWIYSLGAIALIASVAFIGLLIWTTKLTKTLSSQSESIFELRSQLHELLRNQQKN